MNRLRAEDVEAMRDSVKHTSNCRLKSMREMLFNMLAIVEEEIDNRLGKGGGGLK